MRRLQSCFDVKILFLNRSKSKDRGESEYNQKKEDDVAESVKIGVESDNHSSKSSLTSLDLAINAAHVSSWCFYVGIFVIYWIFQEAVKGGQDEAASPARNALCRVCRVILSNGSTTVVQIQASETIYQMVSRLLAKRGLQYSAFEVTTDKHPKVGGR